MVESDRDGMLLTTLRDGAEGRLSPAGCSTTRWIAPSTAVAAPVVDAGK
jgi:hypothetical protein